MKIKKKKSKRVKRKNNLLEEITSRKKWLGHEKICKKISEGQYPNDRDLREKSETLKRKLSKH